MLLEMEIGLKLVLSFVAGGSIGLERELSGHPAGLRTMILVSMGSSSFLMIGFYGIDDPNSVSRIVQGIATGLGFLGAGAIVKERFNIKGLTTAASIWITAAIGSSIALGEYHLAILTLLMTLLSLSVVGIIERVVNLKPEDALLLVRSSMQKEVHGRIISVLSDHRIRVGGVKSDRSPGGKLIMYDLVLPRAFRRDHLLDELENIDGLNGVQLMDHETAKDRLYS
jgi:putative Mg2+ transporter-C (MgtC) family protein